MQRESARFRVVINIGGLATGFVGTDLAIAQSLERRYHGYLASPLAPATCEFTVVRATARVEGDNAGVEITHHDGRWFIRRGSLSAEYDPVAARGSAHLDDRPYDIDSLLRIVHTLLLAREGGFLLHAASAVRDGHALVFAGASGAGKTTICRLAPPDAVLLTDEISYLRPTAYGYTAFGTPFTGELGIPGMPISAPVRAVYLLAHGDRTRIEPMRPAEAVRSVLRHVLFFATEPESVQAVLNAVCQFTRSTPVYRLEFRPEPDVWERI
jgi:hypothetical protein